VTVAIAVAAETAAEAAKQEDYQHDNENEAKRHDLSSLEEGPPSASTPATVDSCAILLTLHIALRSEAN
jgi:hypothetical protein